MLTMNYTATAVSQIGLLAGLCLSVKHYSKINNNLNRAWLYKQSKEHGAAFLETVHFKAHRKYFIKILEKNIHDLQEKKVNYSKKFHVSRLLTAVVFWCLHIELLNFWKYLDLEGQVKILKTQHDPHILAKSLSIMGIAIPLALVDLGLCIKSVKSAWDSVTYRRDIDSKIMRDQKLLDIIQSAA